MLPVSGAMSRLRRPLQKVSAVVSRLVILNVPFPDFPYSAAELTCVAQIIEDRSGIPSPETEDKESQYAYI